MEFDWDERKNQVNLVKHGLDFAEPKQDMIRVISFRKATTGERKRYEQAYRDELGTH